MDTVGVERQRGQWQLSTQQVGGSMPALSPGWL